MIVEIPATSDLTTPLRKALHDCPIDAAPAGLLSRGLEIRLEAGDYRLPGTVEIARPIRLAGTGGACRGGTFSCRVMVADGQGGLVLAAPGKSKDGGSAHGSIVENLALVGEGQSSPEAVGILMQVTAELRGVYCGYFGGHGLEIFADTNQQAAWNANLWRLDSCSFQNNARCGVYLHGDDVNQGTGTNCDFSHNGEWGCRDDSFLGNCWIAPHASYNGTRDHTCGSYRIGLGGPGQSLVLMPYAEGNPAEGPSVFGPNVAVIWPNVPNFTGGQVLGWSFSRLTLTEPPPTFEPGIPALTLVPGAGARPMVGTLDSRTNRVSPFGVGPAGPKGDPGPQGPQGIAGPVGPAGKDAVAPSAPKRKKG